VGGRAVDEIIPQLLDMLTDPDAAEDALDGLRQVSRLVFDILCFFSTLLVK
jgi:hypothetical protein